MEIKSEENEFYNEIFFYVYEVFIGIETKLFKECEDKKGLKEKLTTHDGMLMGANTLETYLNQVYRGLVEKNDTFVLEQFQKFEKYSKLNSVNLLNLISVPAMNVYQKMNRSKLNINSDLENYINSVKPNLEVMRKYYLFLFDKDYAKSKDRETSVLKLTEDVNEINKF